MPTFGERIRELRNARGLTQRELANIAKINFTYLSNIENDRLDGDQPFKQGTVELLAQALDVDGEELTLLAKKIPHSLKQRIVRRSDAFRKMTWLDDDALDSLLAGLDERGRQSTESAFRRAHDFLQNTLDTLASHIAVLDKNGTIIAVNAAWRRFATDNGLDEDECGPGTDYLAACEAATGLGADNARAAVDGIRDVIDNRRSSFYLEYPCHSPDERRWFSVRVTRFEEEGKVRAVVAHDTITERKIYEEKLRAEKDLLRKSLELAERERQLVSGEVHDGFVQEAIGAKMVLEAVSTRLAKGDVTALNKLDEVQARLGRALGEARCMVSDLRPQIVGDEGLLQAIERFLKDERNVGMRVTVFGDLKSLRLDPLLESNLFRIVQEAITNVRRHAKCDTASVLIVQAGEDVTIEVTDGGVGFDTSELPADHFGLRIIQERARIFGGDAVIESVPGRGTKVCVQIPLSPPS